jgi:hypothetical protein
VNPFAFVALFFVTFVLGVILIEYHREVAAWFRRKWRSFVPLFIFTPPPPLYKAPVPNVEVKANLSVGRVEFVVHFTNEPGNMLSFWPVEKAREVAMALLAAATAISNERTK